MTTESLEQKMARFAGPAAMLREAPVGAYVYPVPPEHTSWRDEQRALREDVVLIDQSFHMTDLYFQGPDALKLVSGLAINTFKGFGRNKAKQLVCCNPDGYVIGDGILFGLEDDRFVYIGRPPLANWIQFNAETGGFDVEVVRDERSVNNDKPRQTYRFEIQGPKAWALIEKLAGRRLGEIKFFSMLDLELAGTKVRALRHGMGGAPGLEIWGPIGDGPAMKQAILDAGKEFNLRQFGGRAYGAVAHESGWIPSPLPAIYTGEAMRPYREWLKATAFEGSASLGGSFYPDRIEDFYLTPWDLDYGRLIRFDHEFVGREALERMANEPHRRKVTLEWNPDDVLAVHDSQLRDGENGKFMEYPTAHYASHPYDKVSVDGRTVGVSFYPAYLHPDRQWISLAIIDPDVAVDGGEVTITWGEEGGGSAKPGVERHVQKQIRATITGWPYSKQARTDYRPS